jgi:hypothetical protein
MAMKPARKWGKRTRLKKVLSSGVHHCALETWRIPMGA